MKFLFGILLFVISIPSGPTESIKFPANWKQPIEKDYSEWVPKYYGAIPCQVVADFNSDTMSDTALILLNDEQTKFGLFVLLSGHSSILNLEVRDFDTPVLTMGITELKPGKYTTVSSKQYLQTRSGKPGKIILKASGIKYFQFESSSSVFFWDAKNLEFERVWLID